MRLLEVGLGPDPAQQSHAAAPGGGERALLLGWRRFGTWLACGVSAALLAITVLPIGAWLLSPIENRFPPPALPEEVDGIVMLGGAVEHPVDYRSATAIDLRTMLGRRAEPETAARLIEIDLAVRSWVGLLAYRLLGHTDTLFPAP